MGTVEEKSPWTQPAVIPGRTMVVLYGSETGNAEEIAKEIGDLAERLHFQTSVGEMDSFKLVRSPLKHGRPA
jgi:sulfite reductase alpha subunit-like flavoprotein